MASKFLNISTDITLGGASPSDEIVSSQKAIKDYVDSHGGGSSYTAGTGIDITSNTISTTDPVLVNNAADYANGVAIKGSGTVQSTQIGSLGSASSMSTSIGFSSFASGSQSISIGHGSQATAAHSYSLGEQAKSTAKGAFQFGYGTNNEAGTVQFGLNTGDNNSDTVNYKLLDSDGTIPEARLADTTSAVQGQVLTLDSNLNAIWAAAGGGDIDCGTMA